MAVSILDAVECVKTREGTMARYQTMTIYTDPSHSWEDIERIAQMPRTEIIDVNPHLESLVVMEPGVPIDIPYAAKAAYYNQPGAFRQNRGRTAYEVAREELRMNVAEIPGTQHNARIMLYHSTTVGGAAPDETPWCSSFVNYCVEQSGLVGTDSKAARSWKNWGRFVDRADWRVADLVVFWTGAPNSTSGHVGFLVAWDGPRPFILGGNQNDRLCIADLLPYNQILSVRRAG
jgi:uncharacterized protein (TIGR02594 family)